MYTCISLLAFFNSQIELAAQNSSNLRPIACFETIFEAYMYVGYWLYKDNMQIHMHNNYMYMYM